MKMAEDEQKDRLKTKLEYVKANRDHFPSLHFAARVSDIEVCRHLVEQEGADINELCRRFGATTLHYAAMNELHGEALIDYFLEKKCNLERRDRCDKRAIDYALKARNFELAIKLYYSSQNLKSFKKRQSLLHFSLNVNNLEFAKFVSTNDVKLCKDLEYDYEILLKGCKCGDVAICKWLLEEVKITDKWFWGDKWKSNVLGHAAANRNYARDVLQYLFSRLQISTDDQKNAYGYALVAVVKRKPFIAEKAEELIQLLGCNIRMKVSGYTFMHYAVTSNLFSLKFLHGKDTSLIDEVSDDGATVLHFAAIFGDVNMCMWLIEHGQDIYAMNKNNRGNFLHYAAQNAKNGHLIIKKFGHILRDLVHYFDNYYYTPLHLALVNDRLSSANALLQLRANLRLKRKGNNFLHFCIVMGKLKSAKFVHANNKNLIKEKGEGGKTTLHIAADNFDEEICAWLVSEGAHPEETTTGGKTVLESTCSENAKKFLQSLIRTRKWTYLKKIDSSN